MSNVVPKRFGHDPEYVTIVLIAGMDYDLTLELFTDDGVTPQNYPVGTSVYMKIGTSVVWNATVSGNEAIFSVDATAVDDVIAVSKSNDVVIVYENGLNRIPWYIGSTEVKRPQR